MKHLQHVSRCVSYLVSSRSWNVAEAQPNPGGYFCPTVNHPKPSTHPIISPLDARGDEGAHSKHRSLPSSQLDLSEPASCLRRNRTPIQEHSDFYTQQLKKFDCETTH
ncbi:hypothetical protein fugu_010590 [Takifugu bimaculatus]|uniref:Uncharacterized protein n=1 Tax=Takifugu bimaculatus TaxID=433685 RepID=A0A4Z2CAE4_9TELE|nr:hypothetical protein fugu_010590 [Takifugu bimaculatus]